MAASDAGVNGIEHDFDYLVVGSGFGGSVSALRLAEKGYRVGVLECGRRFEDEDFAETAWRAARLQPARRAELPEEARPAGRTVTYPGLVAGE